MSESGGFPSLGNVSFTSGGGSKSTSENRQGTTTPYDWLYGTGSLFPFPDPSGVQANFNDPFNFRAGQNPVNRPGGGAGGYVPPALQMDPTLFKVTDVTSFYNSYAPDKAGDLPRMLKQHGYDQNEELTLDQWAEVLSEPFGDASGRSKGIATSALGRLQQVSALRAQAQNRQGAGTGGQTGGQGQPLPPPAGPPLPPQYAGQLANNTAQGLTWNPTRNQWEQVTGRPDVIWDAPSNQYYYQGQPITQEQLHALGTYGPQALSQASPGNQMMQQLAGQLTQRGPEFDWLMNQIAHRPQIDAAGLMGQIRDPSQINAQGLMGQIPTPPQIRAQMPQPGFLPPPMAGMAPVADYQPVNFQATPEMLQAMRQQRTSYLVPRIEEERDEAMRRAQGTMAKQGMTGLAAANQLERDVAQPYGDRIFDTHKQANDEALSQWYGVKERVAIQDAQNRMQTNLANAGLGADAQQNALNTLAQMNIARAQMGTQTSIAGAELGLNAQVRGAELALEAGKARAGIGLDAQKSNAALALDAQRARAGLGLDAGKANLESYLQVLGLPMEFVQNEQNRMLSLLGLLYEGSHKDNELAFRTANAMTDAQMKWFSILNSAGQFGVSRSESTKDPTQSYTGGIG